MSARVADPAHASACTIRLYVIVVSPCGARRGCHADSYGVCMPKGLLLDAHPFAPYATVHYCSTVYVSVCMHHSAVTPGVV